MNEAVALDTVQQLMSVPPHATGALIIRLDAIRRNYRILSEAAPAAETAAVLKADGYGLGAARVIAALEKEGCRTFFVATLGEAQALRGFSKEAAIYVLDGLFPHTAGLFENIEARPVLGSLDEIAEWSAFCEVRGKRLPAAIHFDTGMTRLGLAAEEVQQLSGERKTLAHFDLCLVMSHLACADDPRNAKNEAQRARFVELSTLFPGVPRSLANSAGIYLGPAFHFDVTRPGISLYGGRAQCLGVNPMHCVVSLFGRIAQVHWAKLGETVGYGAAQTLRRPARVATVCAGYADGYFRALSASDRRVGPSAYIGERRLPLLGRVSMDLTTFDATDMPDEEVQRGGWVELLGERATIDDLAALAGTIGYEVLTSLGRRYHRIYVDE